MQNQVEELIESVVKTVAGEYEFTLDSLNHQMSNDELINKLIIAESAIRILKDRVKVLEWENNIWNSSDGFRLARPIV
ncbi:MAG: hypothetical protein ABIQ31_02315 [Ferruginibacter sp.]